MMYCLYCSHEETKVLESRICEDSLRRRRECLRCNNRFTTYERAVLNLNVRKRDGREESLDMQKIAASIKRALGKVDDGQIKSISEQVQQKVLKKKTDTITSKEIGRFVLQELKKSDKIAYLRFASVHKQIEDPITLKKEIQQITKRVV